MEIQSSNNLAVPEYELLAPSCAVKASKVGFEYLPIKIIRLEHEGKKITAEHRVLVSLILKTMGS